jgi:cytochrome c
LKEPLKVAMASGASDTPKLAAAEPQSPLALAKAQNCLACHAVAQKMVGPAFRDVAARYKGNTKAEALLSTKISQGGMGNWGAIPMPAQPQLANDDVKTLARWILDGAK